MNSRFDYVAYDKVAQDSHEMAPQFSKKKGVTDKNVHATENK